MNIDWSKAPEGFPLWLEGTDENHRKHSGWYRRSGQVFEGSHGGQWRALREGQFFTVHINPTACAWNGEGLPPVGTVCEIELLDREWMQVVVVAVTDYRIYCEETSHHECVDGPSEWCPVKAHAKFRPIRTPEQIAAEERDKAVREMQGIGGIQRQSAEWIYDAGYRKQVTP